MLLIQMLLNAFTPGIELIALLGSKRQQKSRRLTSNVVVSLRSSEVVLLPAVATTQALWYVSGLLKMEEKYSRLGMHHLVLANCLNNDNLADLQIFIQNIFINLILLYDSISTKLHTSLKHSQHENNFIIYGGIKTFSSKSVNPWVQK